MLIAELKGFDLDLAFSSEVQKMTVIAIHDHPKYQLRQDELK